jgi:Zn-dependent protease
VKAIVSAPENYFALPLALMAAAGVFVNVIFMVLNLLPLPPLDGGRILMSLLPHRLAYGVARIEPYGLIIMLVLLMTGALGFVLWPLIAGAMWLIAAAFGIPVADLIRLAHMG